MKRPTRIILSILAAGALASGLGACSGTNASDENAPIQETQDSPKSVEESSPSVADALVGVWQSADGNSTFAYTGTDCFSMALGVSTPYKVDGTTVTLTNFGKSCTITSLDGDTLTTDNTKGTFHRLDEDPERFIAENCIVLTPGKEWSNEAVSVQAQQLALSGDGGFHTSSGSAYPSITDAYCAECLVSNLESDTIFNDSKFLVNESIWTSASTLNPSVDPLQSADTVFFFNPATDAAESVKSVKAVFRYYTINQDGLANYVTPWIVVEQG